MAETSGRLLALLSLLQTPREWPGPGAGPPARRHAPGRCATTSSGCGGSATRSRRRAAPSAATGSPPGRRCRRCCSTTTRPSPSRSACAPRPAARSTGLEETALRALTKLQQVLPQRLAPPGRRAAVAHRPGRRPAPRPAGRRRGAGPARRGRARPRDPALRLLRPLRRRRPSAGSSRTGWSTGAAAGTSSPSTWSGRLAHVPGRPDGAAPRRSATGSPLRPLPAEDIAAYVAAKTRQVQMKLSGRVTRARARRCRRRADGHAGPRAASSSLGPDAVPAPARRPHRRGPRLLARRPRRRLRGARTRRLAAAVRRLADRYARAAG